MGFVAWEWAGLAGITKKSSKLTYAICFFCIVSFLYQGLGFGNNQEHFDKEMSLIFLCIGLLFWISSVFFLYHYPKYFEFWNKKYKLTVMGLLVIIPAWNGMIVLKFLNPEGYLLLLIVILVAATDIGAYFIGRNFGRIKLAEKLSPNKTWEGVLGGGAVCVLTMILMTGIVDLIFPAFFQVDSVLIIFLTLTTIVLSVVGDLLESMLKRNQGIKDSGNILPGHGGILDRVDGLLAVVPCFSLILLLTIK
tara:strand:- start:217 stop:966 length:750 start_codon:yes stop_codon:yes gene_type:complete